MSTNYAPYKAAALRRAFKKATLLHYDKEAGLVYLSDAHWLIIVPEAHWPADLPKATMRDTYGNGWQEDSSPPDFQKVLPVPYGTEDSDLLALEPANSLPVEAGLILVNAGEETEAIVYQTPKQELFGLSRAFLRRLLDIGCEVRTTKEQKPDYALPVTMRGQVIGAVMPLRVEPASLA